MFFLNKISTTSPIQDKDMMLKHTTAKKD